MMPRVQAVRYVSGYVLELEFSDGTTGTIDFRNRIVDRGGVFAPLEDTDAFRQVRVDMDAGTIVWACGVDFCPDVLYHEVLGIPITV